MKLINGEVTLNKLKNTFMNYNSNKEEEETAKKSRI